MMDATGGNVTQPNEATFFHPSAKKPAHLSRILMCLTQLKAKKVHTPKNVAEKGDWKKAKASVGNSDTFLHVWFTFLVISNFW